MLDLKNLYQRWRTRQTTTVYYQLFFLWKIYTGIFMMKVLTSKILILMLTSAWIILKNLII